VIASIVDVNQLVADSGYPLLFVLVMSESGGIPIPGETALIAAAVLASRGKLSIELVIVIAATAAIVGDNIGYLIGRKGGRWLLERPGAFHRQRHDVLRVGEPFFQTHGSKAVFFGRFVLGLRVWASWLAGATHMRWRSFALWNALGGILWASAIGLIAYFIGRSASHAIEAFGVYGLVALLLAIVSTVILHRRHVRNAAHAPVEGDAVAAGADAAAAGADAAAAGADAAAAGADAAAAAEEPDPPPADDGAPGSEEQPQAAQERPSE
jgi:membrane protein DedA with SNARE-associated domain